MEIIFGIEELISEGIMSMEAREVITTEQLLHKIGKDEIEKAYNEYEEIINANQN